MQESVTNFLRVLIAICVVGVLILFGLFPKMFTSVAPSERGTIAVGSGAQSGSGAWDLRIDKAIQGSSSISVNQTVTFQLTIDNINEGESVSAVFDIIDTLPTGAVYEGNATKSIPGSTISGPTRDTQNNTLSWTVDPYFDADDPIVITYDVSFPQEGIFQNYAEVLPDASMPEESVGWASGSCTPGFNPLNPGEYAVDGTNNIDCTQITVTGDPQPGVCGADHEAIFYLPDEPEQLCDQGSGSVPEYTAQSGREWSCIGDNGGQVVACMAYEAFCSDGIIQSEAGETCDDGNTANGDGCSATCQIEECGDGILQTGLGEQCDDGNTIDGDGCDNSCIVEFCGDGILQIGLGEECDDGNNLDDDGCSSTCTLPEPEQPDETGGDGGDEGSGGSSGGSGGSSGGGGSSVGGGTLAGGGSFVSASTTQSADANDNSNQNNDQNDNQNDEQDTDANNENTDQNNENADETDKSDTNRSKNDQKTSPQPTLTRDDFANDADRKKYAKKAGLSYDQTHGSAGEDDDASLGKSDALQPFSILERFKRMLEEQSMFRHFAPEATRPFSILEKKQQRDSMSIVEKMRIILKMRLATYTDEQTNPAPRLTDRASAPDDTVKNEPDVDKVVNQPDPVLVENQPDADTKTDQPDANTNNDQPEETDQEHAASDRPEISNSLEISDSPELSDSPDLSGLSQLPQREILDKDSEVVQSILHSSRNMQRMLNK